MTLTIHTNTDNLNTQLPIVYFTRKYLNTQRYQELLVFENDDFYLPMNSSDELATSLSRSPFGSFYQKSNHSNGLEEFNDLVLSHLSTRNITNLSITHPPAIYRSFIDAGIMEKLGYDKTYTDLNQHIVLKEDWEDSIHKMQQRKLISLREEGFEFKVMPKSEFKTAHQFLTVCRQTQGLQINISWEQLENLVNTLPHTYECFGVFREGKISALCISVRVTNEVAYYYLPATSPMFRSHSPMVLLIAGMVKYYLNNGFKYLDLGVSSINGKVQETLKLFKERMGADAMEKSTFIRSI